MTDDQAHGSTRENPSLGRQLVDALKEANASVSSFSMDRHIELINAYEDSLARNRALAKRVAELEQELTIPFMEAYKDHFKSLLADRKELAAANETIKALRHEMRMQGGAVERETQANARIAELEVAYDCLEKVYNMNRDWIADAKEREAKLVAALEEIEAASHYADELENIRPIAIEALKAHTGGA